MVDDCLVLAEIEFQLLKTTKPKKGYEGVNMKCFKDKYAQILSIFTSNMP